MKMRPLLVSLLVVSLSCSVLAQEKAAKKSASPAKKDTHGARASSSGWKDIGERGEMKWVQGPKVWPEVIVLKLNKGQYGKFQDNPTDFLNKPAPLFSKAVNPMSAECVKRAKDEGSEGADSFYLMVLHDPGSTSCPTVMAHHAEGK